MAVAADVRSGPLSRAKEHIKEHRLEEKIQTRLSDGLANIKPGEADSLIMSGIGGILMMRLLQDEEHTAKSFKELILSPQSELFDVRRYLVSNGYLIEYEHMLCDEGKYYFIFHVLVSLRCNLDIQREFFGFCLALFCSIRTPLIEF